MTTSSSSSSSSAKLSSVSGVSSSSSRASESSSLRPLRVGVVGATGMVGQEFMKMLDDRKFSMSELRPFASEGSLGKKVNVSGKSWDLKILKPGCFDGLDLVFFSSGDDISKEWAPQAVKAGAYAVDNSGAFRMDKDIHLIVPEVNGHLLDENGRKPQIIANPNCSTIQLVVALKPLSDKFGLQEVRVSSYQAVSGAGQAAYDELLEQSRHCDRPTQEARVFPYQILFNAIPQIGSFNSDGYCSEEVKIMKETLKILGLPNLKVSAFTVRVPVLNAHSETVWVTLNTETNRETILETLKGSPGIVVQDDPARGVYATPFAASGTDPVFVSRIHRDPEDARMWLMWVVSDNLRKGAALNGIQIAERLRNSNSAW